MLQTWLPLPNIYPSISILTDDQLCKQRVDAKKILDTLENKSKTYRHHPAVKMWKGHEELLRAYITECIMAWMKRGHSNNMEMYRIQYTKATLPLWWGGPIHSSHRERLVYDNPRYYSRTSVGRKVPSYVLYRDKRPELFWPVKNNGQLR
jgi:hypothetical protein